VTDAAVRLLADRAEIHDVVMRYASGVDRRDMDMVAACFAPDVQVDEWGGGFPDRDTMIRYISGVAVFHTTMHMFGNEFVEVAGDRAQVDSYAMLTHHLDSDDGETRELNVSGARYVETLQRRDGAWVVTRRGGEPCWAPTGVTGVTTADPATQWLLDRAEIHDLIMQYALGVDLRDYDRIRRCFASTFRAAYGDREFTDADTLIDFVSGVEHFPSTTHFLGSHAVDVVGDDAWMRNNALITHRPHEDEPAADWVAASQYVDHLVREDGRWRIAERGPFARREASTTAAPSSEDPAVRALLDRATVHDAIVTSAHALDAADGRHRLLNNERVVVVGDEAEAETYLYVTDRDPRGRPTSWSRGARRWLDRLRREGERWAVIERREVDNRVEDAVVIDATEAAARAGGRRIHGES
jgi:hypothetical protein